MAGRGNVQLVRGLWNAEFLRVLENFPAGKHDDEVDALSGAHETLVRMFGSGTGQSWRAEDQDDEEDPYRREREEIEQYQQYGRRTADLEGMGRRGTTLF